MEFVKSIKKLFLSAYGRLKENVTKWYRYKRINNMIIDPVTKEVIVEINLKYIGTVIKNSAVDVLCGKMFYLKPPSTKGKVIRMLSVLGINGLLAAAIIFIEGTKFSYLLLLKVVVLLYLTSVIFEITDYSYSFLSRDKYYYSSVEPLEGQVLSVSDDEIASDEETIAPEETPLPDVSSNGELVVATHDEEVLAFEEKLETSLLALAIFVAKYSFKGSIVTSDVMYCAFVCDLNTLPQGYKMKLKDFYLKHYSELAAISLSIEGEELIPVKQFRSFCKERMFTKDSSYSKAKYSNEFYSLVKNQK